MLDKISDSLFALCISVNKILNGFFSLSYVFLKFDIFMGHRSNFYIDSVQIIIGRRLFSIVKPNDIFKEFDLKQILEIYSLIQVTCELLWLSAMYALPFVSVSDDLQCLNSRNCLLMNLVKSA